MSESERGPIEKAVIGVFGGSATVFGYSLYGNPEGFVLAVVWRAIVNAAVSTAGEIGATLATIWAILRETTVGTLGSVLGGVTSSLATLIVDDLIGGLNAAVVDVAASFGPFSLVALIVIWAVVTILTGLVLIGLWRAYLLLRKAII